MAECHQENEIRPKDPIRCRDCGYRIMYKKRTRRSKTNCGSHAYLSRYCNAIVILIIKPSPEMTNINGKFG
ncbi:unnamed protein product [Darwinula stevensoni]|uniref:DNA-directed RNA polymerase n=1 Tax=Darwinula stevensoni TaxID=69355 RepID=A0A7R9FQU4_9CRUS|nr:unnamed protein product [Darwinula stevensoni]CAG0899797.1 unnamed protein product [Darwinula stevensoni]